MEPCTKTQESLPKQVLCEGSSFVIPCTAEVGPAGLSVFSCRRRTIAAPRPWGLPRSYLSLNSLVSFCLVLLRSLASLFSVFSCG